MKNWTAFWTNNTPKTKLWKVVFLVAAKSAKESGKHRVLVEERLSSSSTKKLNEHVEKSDVNENTANANAFFKIRRPS